MDKNIFEFPYILIQTFICFVDKLTLIHTLASFKQVTETILHDFNIAMQPIARARANFQVTTTYPLQAIRNLFPLKNLLLTLSTPRRGRIQVTNQFRIKFPCISSFSINHCSILNDELTRINHSNNISIWYILNIFLFLSHPNNNPPRILDILIILLTRDIARSCWISWIHLSPKTQNRIYVYQAFKKTFLWSFIFG